MQRRPPFAWRARRPGPTPGRSGRQVRLGVGIANILLTTLMSALLVWTTIEQLKVSKSLARLEYARSNPRFSASESLSGPGETRGQIRDLAAITLSGSDAVQYITSVRASQMVILRTQQAGLEADTCPLLLDGYFVEQGTRLERSRPATMVLKLAGSSQASKTLGIDIAPTATILEVDFIDVFGDTRSTRLRYRAGEIAPLTADDEAEIRGSFWRMALSEPRQGRFSAVQVAAPEYGVTAGCQRALDAWRRHISELPAASVRRLGQGLPEGW